MEDHLAKSPHGFLVGDRVTIADISCWGWVASHSMYSHHAVEPLVVNVKSVSLTNERHPLQPGRASASTASPISKSGSKTLLQRPGFEKGRNVPKPHTAFDNDHLSEEELDKMANSTRNWVQQGMKADAAKK